MANPIGVLFLIIAVAAFVVFGLGAVETITEEGDTVITEGSDMHGSYTASKSITSQGFNIISLMIWPLIAVFVFAVLNYLA